jgi:hypothetical protein
MKLGPKLRKWTRSRRGRSFRRFLASIDVPARILDLGGTAHFWEVDWGFRPEDQLDITLINDHSMDPDDPNADYHESYSFIQHLQGDVMLLQPELFRKYDLIFSNSLIEHLASKEQESLASRIVQSGTPYFIQTPNKFSPVDPHVPSPLVPFFAAYPKTLQAILLSTAEFNRGQKYPSLNAAQEALSRYNPLGKGDVRSLFPDATLEIERPLGIPMSILAYRAPT